MISPEVLRHHVYFADAKEESVREIARISREVELPAAATIFREGDPADDLYIILKGEVDIRCALATGDVRTVDTAVAGELIMWSALVEPYVSTAEGITRNETRLVAIEAAKLREICDRDHDLGYQMLISVTKLLAARLNGARVQLATAD